jgi:hypothetical protein
MDRIATALVVGFVVLIVQASNAADQDRRSRSQTFGGQDCSRGTIEARLDCLNNEVRQIKQRMEGREVRVMPLQR